MCNRLRVCVVITPAVVRTRVERLIAHVSFDGVLIYVPLCVVCSVYSFGSIAFMCDGAKCMRPLRIVCDSSGRTTKRTKEQGTAFAKFRKCSFSCVETHSVVIALG